MALISNNFQNLEVLFESILENSIDAIWAFDREYKLIAYNPAFPSTFRLFFGEEFNEKKSLIESLVTSSDEELLKNWQEFYTRALREKFRANYEYKLKEKSLYYDLFFNPIIENDSIVGAMVTCKDVTNRKHLEKAIKNQKSELEQTGAKEKEELELLEETKKELEKVKENEATLKLILENMDDGFWDWNVENNTLILNEKYFNILGYEENEFEKSREVLESFIHPEDKNAVLEKLSTHLEGKTSKYESEHRMLSKSGIWVWVKECGIVTKRSGNKPIRITGRFTDISLKKNSEETLRELENRFFNLADNLPFMIWMSSKENQSLYFNKTWLQYRGSNLDDEISVDRKELIHPDDYEYWKNVVDDAYKEKKEFQIEYRLKDKSGEYKWVFDHGIPRFLRSGDFIGFVGAAFDITERKLISDQLFESETKLNEITSVIGEGIFVLDSELKTEFINPEFTKLLGWTENDVYENKLHYLIHNVEENNNDKECPISKVLENGEIVRISEDYFKSKNGEKIPVSYVSSPVFRNGEIVGSVTAFHDIKARKEYEAEIERFVQELQFNKELVEENAREVMELNNKLMESEAQLKELNANKDKFFSIISHDLKSPFTSLLGFSEYLVEDLDDLSQDEIKEFATNIHKAAKNVFNLLENLLQWSRIQTGRIKFSPTQFSLTELTESIIALYLVNAAKKKIKLVNELNVELNVFADKFMIDTVIRNLISNAIKFTKVGGEIKLIVKNEKDFIKVSVKDNGVGMKDEIKSKLFKIDEHVTTKGTDQEKGTGLGLILCKEFVEKNGGKIWVESEVGKGSEFIFTIPLLKEEIKAKPKADA